jgi:hypothetical protein
MIEDEAQLNQLKGAARDLQTAHDEGRFDGRVRKLVKQKLAERE